MVDPSPSYRRRPSEALIPVNLPPIEGIDGDTSAVFPTVAGENSGPAPQQQCNPGSLCPLVASFNVLVAQVHRHEKRIMHVEAENKDHLQSISVLVGNFKGSMDLISRMDANISKIFAMVEEDRQKREDRFREDAEQKLAEAKGASINWPSKLVDAALSAIAPLAIIAIVWAAVRSGAVPIGAEPPAHKQETSK